MTGTKNLDEILKQLGEEDKSYVLSLIEKDGLTGIYNRHFFNQRIEQEVHLAGHSETDVSLLLFDIDDFKAYQDNHKEGHVAGDRTLYQLAQHLQEQTKDYDVVCRYGGEEIAVICPDTKLKEGVETAERLRAYIESFCEVTVSVGVANYKDNAENVVGLIYKADRGLYQAKENGKNKLMV